MGCSASKDDAEQDPWLLCLSGQVKQLERWLARGGNPCALDRQGGRGTLLHAAARGDQAECIKALVKAGADVNAVTKLRGSPLHAAAQHGTGHAVAALLESGADPYVKNAEGKTPMDVATANGFPQTAALMRAAGRPRPNSGQLDSLVPPSTHQQHSGHAQQQQRAVEGAAGLPAYLLAFQLGAAGGEGDMPSVPRPSGEASPDLHSTTSSDGLHSKSTTLSQDPLLSWIGSQLATRGGSTLLTAVPPAAAQQAQQAQPAQQAQQVGQQVAQQVEQQVGQQHAEQQRAEQGSGGSGRSSGSAAPSGSGTSNGAAGAAGHNSSRGTGGGRPVSPSGGSITTPTRTSTLGSSGGSLLVDNIRTWEVPYTELTLQQSIGAGSFGKVYKAKWHETLVAVKVLLDLENVNDSSLTLSNPVLVNLHKECSLMASLRHPNIVQFMGVCSCPPAMITEFCGKGSLTDVLKAGRSSPAKAAQLPWTRRLNMALDAAKGMLYLHKRGIIHRDLKSPNLLIDSQWRCKVADFNLSKLVEGTESSNSKTGTMAGANPKWLAPEVIGGYSATEKGDVWSYGVVMWELLTWDIPWNKVSPWTVVATVMNGGCLSMPPLDDPAQPLPGTAADNAAFAPHLPAYIALIKRCWAQIAYDRPTFEEVIHDLRNICEAFLRAPAADAPQ
ncbi:hypothetical protein COHA_006442 [Chlorella ohadii]|uniref:Protein kinase domain-containing protein n=1 Tax=Chlorella ohadii TaxID=2649997 RepID=A0AAD5DPC5_9CHLO|nr:hypothetical protein COHA_006442 [Chlorella ohadii]